MEKIIQPILASKKVVKPFKTYQVLIPVLLGLFVIGWLFLDEFNPEVFFSFNFTIFSVMFLIL
jgi:hypothetical protein